MNRSYTIVVCAILVLTINLAGCKKLVNVSPPITALGSPVVFGSDATAIAAVTNMYTSMINNYLNGGVISLSFYPELSADNLTLYSGETDQSILGYYRNALTNTNTGTNDFWVDFLYPAIYDANANIEGLNRSSGLTPAIEQQLLGESEFMRAFYYFYLVNLYGDVPLVLTTNYKANEGLVRAPQSQVWQQIIADLHDAGKLLSNNYLDATILNNTNQRVRPTIWAADALLARACLYTGDWSGADSAATALINNSSLFSLDTLNGVFLANSNEAIWQLQPVQSGWNTPDAQFYIIPSTGPSSSWPVYLSPQLLNSFEAGDQRRVGGNWVDSVIAGGTTYYYPYKYKSATFGVAVTEYEMVLRLGEQYLIRAEAEANGAGGGTNAAIMDLNMIRARAGLPGYAGAIDKTSVLNAILHERQVELFTEWGNRWLDLKRTSTVNEVMSAVTPIKSGGVTTWNVNQQWYPIALGELQADPNLSQNNGY